MNGGIVIGRVDCFQPNASNVFRWTGDRNFSGGKIISREPLGRRDRIFTIFPRRNGEMFFRVKFPKLIHVNRFWFLCEKIVKFPAG